MLARMSAEVGKDVEALCEFAKDGEKIVRVQCKQCLAYHRYKAPTKMAKEAHAAKVKAAKEPRVPKEPKAPTERFDRPLVAADLNLPVRPYRASESFPLGQRVSHVTFGEGVVELHGDPGKMTVFFAVGRKVLACAKVLESSSASGGLSRPKPFDHTIPTPGAKAPQ